MNKHKLYATYDRSALFSIFTFYRNGKSYRLYVLVVYSLYILVYNRDNFFDENGQIIFLELSNFKLFKPL